MARKLNCYEVKTRIAEFIDFRLSTPDAYAFAQHCLECEDCMSELKLQLLVCACLSDKDVYNIDEFTDEEIEERFDKIAKRLYFIDMIDRNMKYFVIGATIFLLMAFGINLLI